MATTVTLARTGQKMPLVSFGLWKVTNEICADTVYNAIKSGYRLFDGACDYGNEKEAGEGVRRAIVDGLVKREELFITTKLWNTFHSKEHVASAARKQLQDWGLEYFDLFLIHFPVSLEYVDPNHRYPPAWWGDDKKVHTSNDTIQETWTAMEQLVDDGLAKNIGISNFSGQSIIDILRYARYAPQVLQIEIHPYLTQEPLVKLCQVLGIAVTAYSSLGPQGYIELGMDKSLPSLLSHSSVIQIAEAHAKTPAQVILRWATQRNIAVIPKSNNQERLTQNVQCIGFDLSKADMKTISSLNQDLRLNDPAEIDPRLAIFA
ncbi:Aldo/keto reductase [Cylindrobasidium torrendii FP15055 ss-10]|uniref:Aldo/keto reductase n=1 Tax=Cylindrobasidium torrendii FP15055 ss-10 TaxID=1314674 RepID=A0A0D7BAM6_9AGAR|nr:Aldo/keto reductase [Cylindrobasidium torrendii FP15055 ss-10]